MIEFLLIGTILGLSAGFSPGPLLTLVLSETLRHDIRAGLKVASAPIITDIPIIVFSLFLLAQIAHSQVILAIISFSGALFIARMGIENLRTREAGQEVEDNAAPRSLSRGIITNLLSPHPYLFWFTIGIPLLGRAMRDGLGPPSVFLSSFYFFLVGSKMFLAVIIGKSRSFLSGRIYRRIMQALGILLCIFAVLLFVDGIELLLDSSKNG